MILDEAALERLADAGPDAFAGALTDLGASDREPLLAVIDAAGDWAWDAPVPAGRVAAGCRAVAEAAGWDDAAARAGYVEARGALAAGDVDGARTRLTEVRSAFRTLGDAERVGQVSLGLAHVEAMAGRLDVARAELVGLVQPELSGPFADIGSPAERAVRAKARQNLAAIEVMSGRYETAVGLLRDAEATYLDLGMRREWIDAINNRAIALLGLGRTADAARAVEVATPQLASDEHRDARAELLDTAGRAHLLAGRIAASLDRFREALDIARSAGAEERAAHIELAMADAWSTLHLHEEASTAYSSVLVWAASAGAGSLAAWAELGLGVSLVGMERLRDAESHLRAALDRLEQSAQASGAISAGLALASVVPGEAERASVLDRVLALGNADERPADQVWLELAAFDAGRGDQHLDAAHRIADRIAVPRLRYEVDIRRARALRSAGAHDRALAVLRRAADMIEATRGDLVSERHRRAFLTDRLEAHTELVRTLIGLGGPDHLREAFEVAERSRSRALLDAMSGLVSTRRSGGLDADAAERLERFSSDLEALHNGLLGDEELRGLPALPGDLGALEAAIEHDVPPVGAVAGQADVAGLDELQASLAEASATLVSYHGLGDRLVAFVLGAERFDVLVLPGCRSEIERAARRLDAQLARFRVGQAFTERWASRMSDAADAALAELARLVLDPLADLLHGARRLVIVPSVETHSVPFAALPYGRAHLIDHVDVTMAPSATSWVRCREITAASGPAVLVAVADERAPRVDAEVTSIAGLLPGAQLLTGASGTRAALQGATAGGPPPSTLHLACHGVFHLRHAMFSALRMADGWVTAHELAASFLDGSLVVLSACESGRLSIHAGDEVVGLPRGFLVAGARDVVASSWLAHDDATARLMCRFYADLAAGDDPATALRAAQIAVREQFPHPFHWAAFTVLGAGWRSMITLFSPAAGRAPTTRESTS